MNNTKQFCWSIAHNSISPDVNESQQIPGSPKKPKLLFWSKNI